MMPSNSEDKCAKSDRKSKVIWKGDFLDGKIILAVDSKFNPASDAINNIYFTLSSYDYEFEGILLIRINNLDWLNQLVIRIGELYVADIATCRVKDNDTVH